MFWAHITGPRSEMGGSMLILPRRSSEPTFLLKQGLTGLSAWDPHLRGSPASAVRC